jgi:Antibiotic biosynthesis monooxygenase
MYIAVGIHHPKPGKEQAVLQTMAKFGEAQRGHKGLMTVFAWKDDATGALIGTSIWDSKSDYDAARPDMAKALEGVDFGPLDESIEAYRGAPVIWN